jgi:cytoskeletal protein RodZ
MESLGSYLQSLRLARGVSLEEMARSTCVAARYLEALEGNRWSFLPAPAFTRGFIRAYCQRLGEPPDEALARYSRALSEQPLPVATPSGTPVARPWIRGPVLVSACLMVALGLGLFLLSLAIRREPPPLVTPPASAFRGSSKPVSVAPSPPVAPAVPPSVAAPARSRLVARTTEPTWVRIQMDNARVVEELLPAGATREWVSTQRFVVTIGNAGGISLELDGRPLPSLGARGAVVHRLVLPQDATATTP